MISYRRKKLRYVARLNELTSVHKYRRFTVVLVVLFRVCSMLGGLDSGYLLINLSIDGSKVAHFCETPDWLVEVSHLRQVYYRDHSKMRSPPRPERLIPITDQSERTCRGKCGTELATCLILHTRYRYVAKFERHVARRFWTIVCIVGIYAYERLYRCKDVNKLNNKIRCASVHSAYRIFTHTGYASVYASSRSHVITSH